MSLVFEKEMVNLKRRRQQKEQGVLSAFVEVKSHHCLKLFLYIYLMSMDL